MTSQRTPLSMLFTVHSWAGIVTGLLMISPCLGQVMVFDGRDRSAN